MERAAEIAPDHGPVEEPAPHQPALLGKERSLVHLLSVLRFVGLTGVYKAAVLARTDAVSPASECRDIAKKYGTERG
jgi:hypothetical protein